MTAFLLEKTDSTSQHTLTLLRLQNRCQLRGYILSEEKPLRVYLKCHHLGHCILPETCGRDLQNMMWARNMNFLIPRGAEIALPSQWLQGWLRSREKYVRKRTAKHMSVSLVLFLPRHHGAFSNTYISLHIRTPAHDSCRDTVVGNENGMRHFMFLFDHKPSLLALMIFTISVHKNVAFLDVSVGATKPTTSDYIWTHHDTIKTGRKHRFWPPWEERYPK